MGPLRHRNTEQLEYTWIRSLLLELPEGARVAYVARGKDRVMTLPEHLVPGWSCGTTSGLLVVDGDALLRGLHPSTPRYYYRSSLCSTAEARPICDRVERGAKLTPVASTTLPARPTMKSTPYDRETIEVGLFTVERP